MSKIVAILTLCLFIASAYGAPKVPSDCDKRLKVMDDDAKIGLIVTDPNGKLYQKETEFNDEYCK